MAGLFIACLAARLFGLRSNWVILCVPAFAIAIIAYVIGRMKRRDAKATECVYPIITWKQVALYLLIGMLVGLYVLLIPLGDPANFIQEIDNGSHLNRIRSFLDSGEWYLVSDGFYPCGWHLIAATSIDMLDVNVTVAENALDFVFSSVVFPLSMLSFLGLVTKGGVKPIMFGAILAPAFVAFPWGIIQFGPLLPNVAGYSLFPALAAAFIAAAEAVLARRHWSRHLFCLVLLLFSCACLHPNTVFLAIAFLTPYCVSVVYRLPFFSGHQAWRIAACLLFVCLVALVWYGLYSASFLQSVVNNNWAAYNTPAQSVCDLFLFRMTERSMQPILGIFVLLGLVMCFRRSEYRWLACAYLIFAVFFIVDTSTEGFAKHFFTGFWYTDPCRISACLAITAIPLASIGLGDVSDLVCKRANGGRRRCTAFTMAIIVLVLLAVYAPQRAFGGYRSSDFFAFDDLRMRLFADTNGAEAIYSEDERAFVREVKDIVGNSSVINSPDDGTLFAYGVDDLNTYYRTPSFQIPDLPEQSEFETDESWVIRSRLFDYAHDADVQSAVKLAGAEYVILLDAEGSYEQQRWLLGYTDKKWLGIDAVSEGTPGFELVHSRGDMRLYRIARLQ